MLDKRPSHTAQRVALSRAAHQLLDSPRLFDDPLGLRIIGAGLDTFAYRNPYPATALRVFEVDHPAIQTWKRQRLVDKRIEAPPGLAFVPMDFEAQTLPAELARAGNNLTMSLKGRECIPLVPFVAKDTFFGVPAYAEAARAPIEDSVEGVAMIDGTMIGMPTFEGVVTEPFEITFEKGRIVKISEGRDARRLINLLDTLGDETPSFAELGVNGSPFAPKKFIGDRLDMAIAGHVQQGLRRNDVIGGNSEGENHLDVQVTWATLLLDGNPILEDGNLKI